MKRSSLIIIKMLRKTMNYPFKDINEKKFIFIRLNLLDQSYCLKLKEKLWESYLDIGLQQQLWPVNILFYLKFIDRIHIFFLLTSRTVFIQWQNRMIFKHVINTC